MLYEVITNWVSAELISVLFKNAVDIFKDPGVPFHIGFDSIKSRNIGTLLVITSYSIHYTKLYEVKQGSGKITVNGRDLEKYFPRPVLRMVINQPFAVTNRENEFDVVCTVKGGGLSGQAGAVRHGISVALNKFEPALRGALKQSGFLTRDSRTVERKKYGKAKARRSFQFSKR